MELSRQFDAAIGLEIPHTAIYLTLVRMLNALVVLDPGSCVRRPGYYPSNHHSIDIHIRALLGLASMVINPAAYTHVKSRYREESLLYQFLNYCYLLAVDHSLEAYDFSAVVNCGDVQKGNKKARLCEPCFTVSPTLYILQSNIELALEISRLVERAFGINLQHHTYQ